MRKVIAERLQYSTFNVPHYYLTSKISIDKLSKLREEINASFSDPKDKLSLNDFFIKAAAVASMQVPETRSRWDGDNGRILLSSSVDISFAVDTGKGLITPIVPNAHKLRLKQIGGLSRQLIDKARNNKLKPEEYLGGTMSISNMGMLGVKQFTAIINPPQSCILAIPAPFAEVQKEGGPAHNILLTMSCDHRVIDGSSGSHYLQILKSIVENPFKMLI